MGRGSSSAGGGGGADMNGANLAGETSMVSARESASNEQRSAIDGVLSVGRDMQNQYGDAGIVGDLNIGTFEGRGSRSVLGYYSESGNLGINKNFLNSTKLNQSYDDCVKSGFHPKRGRKSGAQAVAAHEYGHALTDAYGRKTGVNDIDKAANNIVTNARRAYAGGSRGKGRRQLNVNGISRYARTNAAETVAEAAADVYCNGKRAKVASRYIMNEVNRVLKS